DDKLRVLVNKTVASTRPDHRAAAMEIAGDIILRTDHELSGFVDVSALRSDCDGGQPLGKAVRLIELWGDHELAGRIDIAPSSARLLHGRESVTKLTRARVHGLHHEHTVCPYIAKHPLIAHDRQPVAGREAVSKVELRCDRQRARAIHIAPFAAD